MITFGTAKAADTTAKKIDRLWILFNDFATSQMDENSRHSINLYLSDPSSIPEWRMARINQYIVWWSHLWDVYEVKKSLLLGGQPAPFDANEIGNCPVTIWQIKNQ